MFIGLAMNGSGPVDLIVLPAEVSLAVPLGPLDDNSMAKSKTTIPTRKTPPAARINN